MVEGDQGTGGRCLGTAAAAAAVVKDACTPAVTNTGTSGAVAANAVAINAVR